MTGPLQERPLISMVLLAYNQEEYVREAIVGAFAQTYTPLEIVLSDDASMDGTIRVMEQMAADYRGPHFVRVNRNSRNLGIGAHINRVVELSRGELIAGAAGDDISLPDRVQRTFLAWRDTSGRAMSIGGAVIAFGAGGERIEPCRDDPRNRDLFFRATNVTPGILGAAHTWHRRVFDEFGPIGEDITTEDRAILFRSHALGEVVTIDEPLVRRRVHEGNLSVIATKRAASILRTHRNFASFRQATYRQYLRDLGSPVFEAWPLEEVRRAKAGVERCMALWEREARLLEPGRFRATWNLITGLAAGTDPRRSLQKYAVAQFPTVYDRIIADGLRRRIGSATKAAPKSN